MIRPVLLATGGALLALAAPLAAKTAAVSKAQSHPAAPDPATGPTQTEAELRGTWGKAGIQMQWMDRSVRPGDDFNRFVNGKWMNTFQMPADKTRYGSFQVLDDLSQVRLHKIVTELVAKRPDPASDEGRIVAAYTAFMDQAAIERAGLTPARPWLDRIAAAQGPADLYRLFGAPGMPSPIAIDIDADPKQSDRYILSLGLGGLGLPDRDYYLSDNPRFVPIRTQYKAYLAMLLGEAGYADAPAMAEEVLQLETAMARNMWDRAARRNRDVRYNKLTRAELAALPGASGLEAMLAATGPGAAAAQTVLVPDLPPTPERLAQLRLTPAEAAAKVGPGMPATLQLVSSRPVAVWKAWMTARFLSDHAAYLPKRFDEASFAFYGKLLSGQPEQRPRWKRGLSVVEGQLGELVGKIYAARYFPAANRKAMGELVGNLRAALKANLADLTWMGPATKAQAEAKLAAFTPKIGAPDVWKDYKGLAVRPDTPLANAIAAGAWEQAYQDARIGHPVDRAEWHMFPQTVNAYYNPPLNEIVFPAAILQPPFFNLAADPAVNYGGIGAVIGHEMGHGFDDQGSKSDATGNLRDWWTAEDRARFVALTDRLAAQYAAFCPFDEGKTCVNGKLTLGENIGDIGGVSVAYRAYKLSLHGKPAPVIDGLTGDQRFFIAYAQVWRAMAREETARQLLLTDPHSPPQFRVNGIVRNFDEWYRAFAVKPTDKLYLPPAQRIRIW